LQVGSSNFRHFVATDFLFSATQKASLAKQNQEEKRTQTPPLTSGVRYPRQNAAHPNALQPPTSKHSSTFFGFSVAKATADSLAQSSPSDAIKAQSGRSLAVPSADGLPPPQLFYGQ
jgi:hypothetical protein